MKILYAEDEEAVRELVNFILEDRLNLQPLQASNGEQAIEILEKDHNHDIKMIISDYNMPNKNGMELFQYVVDKGLRIPFIFLCSSIPRELESVLAGKNGGLLTYHLPKPFEEADLVGIVEELFPHLVKKDFPPYMRINIFRFLRFNNNDCDVYLKLSNKKFVKVIRKGDLYDHETIQKYIDKKCKFFHVTREDYQVFLKGLTDTILESLSGPASERGEQKDSLVETELAAVEHIHEKTLQLGFDQSILDMVSKTTKSCIVSLSKDKNFTTRLARILKKNNFIYEHSLLTSYISVAMAKRLPWNNSEITEKLCTAALIHDLFLESPILARMEDYSEYSRKNVAGVSHDKNWVMITQHPVRAYQLLKNCQNIPSDVGTIILQHHERPDGSGFPKGIDHKDIGPLSAIFIVAEHFAKKIYDIEINDEVVAKIIKEMEEVYSQGHFKKALFALAGAVSL